MQLRGHLRDQFLRAASSIALNLSEGNAKSSIKDKKRYFQTAYASCHECQTILKLMKSKDAKADRLLDHLGGSIYKLMNAKLTAIQPRNSDSEPNSVNG